MRRLWILASVLALTACQSSGEDRPFFTHGTHTPRPEATSPVEGVESTPTPKPEDLDPISHTVRFAEPQTHYVEVSSTFPTDGADSIEVMMATWTPGSYLIREYSRHIEGLSAVDSEGRAVDVEKTRKNRWRVGTNGDARVTIRYRLYCREMTVRTNWVEADFAMLNGAATYLTLVDQLSRPHEVRFELPPTWSKSFTSLSPLSSGEPHQYRAASYDELVDSPVVLGTPAHYDFTVGETDYTLVNVNEATVWDGARSAADVHKLTETIVHFWGDQPMDRYLFLNMLVETGGGLEHKNSTMLMSSRWSTTQREQYVNWLRLVSHEFFHTWNVKRLRPVELGPFDYEHEVYTDNLWIAEGITSYYDRLLVHRAGLSTREEYLAELGKRLSQHLRRPGRKIQALDESSRDAWIKYYRANENSPNSEVSYYVKGAAVAFLLDAKIRKATNDERSLDDVMRRAYQLYSGETGYTSEQFAAVINEVAGTDLSVWLHKATSTTEDLDFTEALAWYGLQMTPPEVPPGTPEAGFLGVDAGDSAGKLVVSRVYAGTPAYEAGINVGDEILAISGFRVDAGSMPDRLSRYHPGKRVTVLVSRRGELIEIPLVLGEAPQREWVMSVLPEASADQTRHLASWLISAERS